MSDESFNNRRFWLFICAFFLLKCWIAASVGLGDDEAYYWDWTRELAGNYYDHPPLTAWLIMISCSILGDTQFAVRLPALICGFLAVVFLYRLATVLFNARVARWSGVLFCLIPLYSLGSIMIVPDVPLLAIWLAMLLILSRLARFHQLLFVEWILLGLLAGLGALTKFTIVLLPFSVFLYMLLFKRGEFLRPGPWVATLLMLAVFSPVLLWNADHDWVTFAYHFSERHGNSGLNWTRFGQFLSTQFAFLTPAVFISMLAMLPLLFFSNSKVRFLMWMGVPTLLIFSTQPLFSEFKPHWTAPGYLSLIPILALGLTSHRLGQFKWLRRGAIALIFLFLLPINTLFYAQTKYPLVEKIHQKLSPEKPWVPNWDPTNDLYGWPQVAEVVNSLAQTHKSPDGSPPHYLVHRYQLAGPMSFYTGQHAWAISSRRDQYDFFSHRPSLRGKNAVVVSDNRYSDPPETTMRFERCEKQKDLPIQRYDVPSRVFYIWLCYNYMGPV